MGIPIGRRRGHDHRSLEPHRPALAVGERATANVPAYVTSPLPAKAIWGRFWLRVQHRPQAGATVVMAVTGDGAGMFLKLQADGRLALVLGGGVVAAVQPRRWHRECRT